ncbi:hypothetical protein EYF80_032863 [Liparis tanakae]|uniref:Uncharacterized protein n=1 Tax=Liparis tanakae TaxID=230148 RepID=A0A4Z2GVT9_9TELE|nr:hypothetical protein EYF80_032863 [Liparis tanakae]
MTRLLQQVDHELWGQKGLPVGVNHRAKRELSRYEEKMLLMSLDRNVCLSEPRLNSFSFVANAVVLKTAEKKECKN